MMDISVACTVHTQPCKRIHSTTFERCVCGDCSLVGLHKIAARSAGCSTTRNYRFSHGA